jgi:hypothetical protein
MPIDSFRPRGGNLLSAAGSTVSGREIENGGRRDHHRAEVGFVMSVEVARHNRKMLCGRDFPATAISGKTSIAGAAEPARTCQILFR